MKMHMNRTRLAALVALTLATTATLSACGGGGDEAGEAVTLRVSVFGNFGYEDLYKQFEKDHPGVKIVEAAEGDLGQYNTQLTQKIAAGSGAGDVVAIEEGQVVNFLQSADKFVNFQDHGSNDKKDQWLDWKYAQATTADGADTIGLGTDVGGLAMCYRRDLFEKAGLPTDRDEVSALWPTWDDYIATGEKFQEGIGDDEVHFVDSATNTYNSILMQSGDHTYFDTDGNLVIDSNPAVKGAWDTSVKMVDAGITARLKSFSNEWNAGFKNGTFATIACPAWMTGYIKEQAGEANAASGTSPPSPVAAATGAARSSPSPPPATTRTWPSSWPTSCPAPTGSCRAFDAVGNLPVQPDALRHPGAQGRHQRLLQRRPGRADLRGRSDEPEAGLPRREEPARARRRRERAAQRRERAEVLRRRLGHGSVQDAEAAAG